VLSTGTEREKWVELVEAERPLLRAREATDKFLVVRMARGGVDEKVEESVVVGGDRRSGAPALEGLGLLLL
jgi:hypothetical protein